MIIRIILELYAKKDRLLDEKGRIEKKAHETKEKKED